MEDPGIGVRLLAGGRKFLSILKRPNWLWAHPAFYATGTVCKHLTLTTHSLPYSEKVTNVWSLTSSVVCNSMARRLYLHRANVTFILRSAVLFIKATSYNLIVSHALLFCAFCRNNQKNEKKHTR